LFPPFAWVLATALFHLIVLLFIILQQFFLSSDLRQCDRFLLSLNKLCHHGTRGTCQDKEAVLDELTLSSTVRREADGQAVLQGVIIS